MELLRISSIITLDFRCIIGVLSKICVKVVNVFSCGETMWRNVTSIGSASSHEVTHLTLSEYLTTMVGAKGL